ncbi:TPA: hypothetical protein N0F65_002398 [Lagenidium giganteum]|uniref:PIPK domain-containing protein n=1 Tax=Lagenidium giganteum TaxID=4803 RepID=A0AAV2YL15_9STRA|nr:TPA: hypothetical protein N0F65_002398 [Lagenidium giganteum]
MTLLPVSVASAVTATTATKPPTTGPDASGSAANREMRRVDSERRRAAMHEGRETPVLGEHTYMRTSSPHPSNSVYLMEQTPLQVPLEAREPMQRDSMLDVQSNNSDGSLDYHPPITSSYAPVDPYQASLDQYGAAHQPLMSTPRATNNNVIRVINKDMTAQFRGRAASVAQARIRWFENRKSQLLGCCLTMAFFGITIAMYNYRWTGLIAGSVNTIICGSAVVITYYRKKHWHQHPNPIVHIRAVLGIFMAVCMLMNVWVDFNPAKLKESATNQPYDPHCRKLAGLTEFFFFTSEAWGLVMACDLFFSLTSPFTSYKRLMGFYHMWVWLGGVVMAIIAGTVADAGGFFTVDGQAVRHDAQLDSVVGFCLASSQICCTQDKHCPKSYPYCEESNFLRAQQWPWILIYSFVIIVLFVSVCVLTLAWHRLYLRGVPKTYNIRLRVLNYVSFFTGAYVFYWLLLLLLYMCAYFLATNSAGDETKSAIAQVLRQLVVFLIASKGYLDYVIWFAVNSIERRPAGGGNRGQESADVDVDLSPQVNTALRSEILYYTTAGIKQSAHALADEVISIPISGESDSDKSIRFWSYCPVSFRNIRQNFGIEDYEYTELFGATTKERFSEGRSGAFMFFTGDERLIVKTMSPEECNFLRKIAKNYEAYMIANPNTMLTRFFGCHAVSLYGKTYYFVVMENLFADTQVVHHRYDIKGSWVDRNAKVPKPGDKATCRYCNASYTFGSTRNQECGDSMNFHEPDIVLKDNDLMMKIRIDPVNARQIYDQIHKDSDFLCEQGIMDYSLLMGVQSSEYFVDSSDLTIGKKETLFTQAATSVSGPSLYHFGIIDILQQWTFEKKMERFYKTTFKRKDPDGVSAMPPKPYKFRFQQKMSRIFALSNRSRTDGATFHRSHPALIDVLDQSDFTNGPNGRPGTFTGTFVGGGGDDGVLRRTGLQPNERDYRFP